MSSALPEGEDVRMTEARNTPNPTQPTSDTQARPADPCIMVIFGATGDLTKRKLIPALYNLETAGLLPRDEFAVLGMSSSEMSDEDFRRKIGGDIRQFATRPVDEPSWDWFGQRLHYTSG